jgi:hemolysin III
MYYGERFNSFSHLAGTVFAAIGTAVLVVRAAQTGDPWKIVAVSVFGATLVFLYAASTIYHSVRGKAKRILRKLDHCAIYFLIAGTYTPFSLVTLRGPLGWTFFGLAWGLACLGVVQEFIFGKGARVLSVVIYVCMGWMGVVLVSPLAEGLGSRGLALVLAGGVLYTGGIVFYGYDERIRHFHGIWHLFVLGGSIAHFLAIVIYVV